MDKNPRGTGTVPCRRRIMSEAFVHEMEELLVSMRNELLEKLTEDNSDFREMVNSMGIKDSIDVAADDIAFKKMEAINKHEANRLRSIENAIARIHNGKYGYCLRCGKKIPEERLRAIPYAVLCIDCKNAEEVPGRK
jgi:RNA polymerase-binding protein DksA